MQRDFHFKLMEQEASTPDSKCYAARLKLSKYEVLLDVTFPGEDTPRAVWIEVSDGALLVRTYDPLHDGPKTTEIKADQQVQHQEHYE